MISTNFTPDILFSLPAWITQYAGVGWQLEKQRKMNELDVVVTLRLHQMENVVNGDLPTDMSQSLVFEAPALVSLRHRIEELEQERIVQKRQHQ